LLLLLGGRSARLLDHNLLDDVLLLLLLLLPLLLLLLRLGLHLGLNLCLRLRLLLQLLLNQLVVQLLNQLELLLLFVHSSRSGCMKGLSILEGDGSARRAHHNHSARIWTLLVGLD